MYKQSDSINELATALSAAQRLMEGAAKDSANPFFKSRYADLSSIWLAIREPLGAHGLSVIQVPAAEGSKITITTLLCHTSGQWISSELTMAGKDDSPQGIGSAITYARRYALAAICGVAPEDDDGEKAQGRSTPTGSAKPQGHAPTPQESTVDLRMSITTAAQNWLKKFMEVSQPQEFRRVLGLHGYEDIGAIPLDTTKAKLLFEDLRMALADCRKVK